MLINLDAWINSQAVRVKATQVDMLVNIPNLVAVNTSSNKIAAIGKTEEEMKQQSPVGWRMYGRRIRFITPFTPREFDPAMARSVLMFYAHRAMLLARPGTFAQLLGYLVDRFTYDIQFAAYDMLAAELRAAFERHLRAERTLQRVLINGRIVKGN